MGDGLHNDQHKDVDYLKIATSNQAAGGYLLFYKFENYSLLKYQRSLYDKKLL